ncbi:MAG: signal peptidase I [Oligoflexales bacterium]|jgi:signal peptidase I|nr:signal peptidase I [Oligoflexales bacterium]
MTALNEEQIEAIKKWRLKQFRGRLGRLVTVSFLLASIYMAISQWAFLSIKVTESIDGKLFLVLVDQPPKKGDLVMFKAKKSLVDVIGMGQWTKFVCGVEGDVISHRERTTFINNVKVGEAVTRSKLFKKDMEMTDDGVIPKGFVFVCGTHKKSFDSKYKLVGLVDEKTFIGRAIRLF